MLLLLLGCAPGAWFSTDSAIAFDVADVGWTSTTGEDGSRAFHMAIVSTGSACDALADGSGDLHAQGTFPDPLDLYGSSWAQGGAVYQGGGGCQPVHTGSGELDLNFLDEDQGVAAGEMWGSFDAGTFALVFDANRCDGETSEWPTC